MARHIEVMIAAIVIAILVMLVAAGPVGRFVAAHPTIKMLALSFLILVGVMLVADGIGLHIPRAICISPWPSRWASRPSTCWPAGRGRGSGPESRTEAERPGGLAQRRTPQFRYRACDRG